MKKIVCLLMAVVMLLSLCACGDSNKTDDPAAANGSENANTAKEEVKVDSPVGYYSLSELSSEGETQTAEDFEAWGFTYYLVLEEDGTGYLDMFGEKEILTWDDKMVSGEDIGSMNYTYANGVIKLEGDGSSMSFAKLSEEKLADYKENGAGNIEDLFGGLGDMISDAFEEGERFENEGALENCYVKFLGAEPVVDEDGRDSVRVWYEFKNTGDEIVCPGDNIYLSGKQGETELESTYIFDDVPEGMYSGICIVPGLTIRCAKLFNYDPEGGEMEFSLGAWFGDKVCYVVDPKNMPGAPTDSFNMSSDGANIDYKLSGVSASDSNIEILGSEIVKDYADNDVILFHLRWTNNGEEEDSFCLNYNYYALQDGYGLSETSSDSYTDEQANSWHDVKPGESIDVALVYNLRNESDVAFILMETYAGDGKVGGIYSIS